MVVCFILQFCGQPCFVHSYVNTSNQSYVEYFLQLCRYFPSAAAAAAAAAALAAAWPAAAVSGASSVDENPLPRVNSYATFCYILRV